jgi:hypothetical protein
MGSVLCVATAIPSNAGRAEPSLAKKTYSSRFSLHEFKLAITAYEQINAVSRQEWVNVH